MYSVFKEFYSLEPLIRQGMEDRSKNYMVIRLVTVVEQFFRCVVENRFRKYPNLVPHEISISKQAIDNMFADAEWSMNGETKLALVSATYSFQSAWSIKKEMKRFSLFDEALENKVDCLDTLFRMRHTLIHTVEPRLCNVSTLKKYYDAIEEIMKMTLDKLNIPEFSFDLQKGQALYSLGWSVGSANEPDGCFIDEQIDLPPRTGLNDELKWVKMAREYNEKVQICFDAALKCFKSIIKENPNDLETLVEMVYIYTKRRDWANVETYADRVLKIEPDNAIACYCKGMTLLKTKPNVALKWFKKSVEGDQYISFTYELLIRILIKAGKNEEALIHVDRAIERNPNDPIWYFEKGRILHLLNMKGYEEACKSLGAKKAINFVERHYNNIEEYNNLIRKLLEYGNDEVIDECQAVFGKHLGRRPAWKSLDHL